MALSVMTIDPSLWLIIDGLSITAWATKWVYVLGIGEDLTLDRGELACMWQVSSTAVGNMQLA